MGTSKGYLPPTGFLWSKTKRSVTNMVKHNFESEYIGKAVGNYSKAVSNGSGSRISNLAVAGSRASAFFGVASSEGFNSALEKNGLGNLINKDSPEVYAGLLDYFTGNGSTLDDSIVRDSMSEVLKELLANLDDGASVSSAFEQMDISEFVVNLITKFVQKDFLLMFAEKIKAKCGSIKKYMKAEVQIKKFIDKQIRDRYNFEELSGINWNNTEGSIFIEKRCNEVFKVFNVYLGD